MKVKNLLAIIIVIVVIIIIITLISKSKDKGNSENTVDNGIQKEEYTVESTDGNKTNTSEALKEEREELGYKISNISLERQDAQTIFSLQLNNEDSIDKPAQLVDIVFLDKYEREQSRMALYIREIKAGESITTQATINDDFTNVYNFRLEERK